MKCGNQKHELNPRSTCKKGTGCYYCTIMYYRCRCWCCLFQAVFYLSDCWHLKGNRVYQSYFPNVRWLAWLQHDTNQGYATKHLKCNPILMSVNVVTVRLNLKSNFENLEKWRKGVRNQVGKVGLYGLMIIIRPKKDGMNLQLFRGESSQFQFICVKTDQIICENKEKMTFQHGFQS